MSSNINSTDIFSLQYLSVQKEIEEHKEEIKKIQLENKKHENTIQNMIKDMDSLKKEIDERDETIQDKVSLF